MNIIDVRTLNLPEVKVVRYGRFADERGYFTETYRKSDFQANPQLGFLKNLEIVQTNVSYSKKGVVRGLHIQWNPHMGKLVRVVLGHMLDLFMDIRKNSPNFGKIAILEMKADFKRQNNEWIWIPVGFAHGTCFLEDTAIEYYCTAEYNPKSEASISPLAGDIDWSVCDPNLKKIFEEVVGTEANISEKDKKGHTLSSWSSSPDSDNFLLPT